MRFTFVALLLMSILTEPVYAYKPAHSVTIDKNDNFENPTSMGDTLVIKVGSKEFKALLPDSPTAIALKAMLPLRVNMTELNGNEKYFRIKTDLPTDASNPGKINAGDLMLWGSNTVVLFYKSFSTSYNYTRIGKITNPAGLAAALGQGNVEVTLSLK